ncbi:Cro/Cl family transcriptional regulator [Clostridium botulinum A2B7 92]|uniref:Sugar-binding transcriptional regulator n=1 Tax=Clostridium botulinum TaxID=1491 RepID=A0A846J4M4_CLOBO|nr:sugar-binding transcriptional regulator [Clostridium botulinum]ACA54863.1 putative glucitol operon regulator SorC [Clostridium botulinum A3 str. Loch Maree]KEI95422.1 Cro/Cl family transcriptional regulator [Clostridium botulinum A2B7 92]NFH64881.1 sugar-binding transcriptional regulator [Clostridium botulinum]NFJ08899.1 sugar-binding transcriptional regulator [Clostridium botulinum]NFK16167.1 sugar-binding transcriptional regulator [Clostridium botulinum]
MKYDDRILYKVAQMYYIDNMTQSEIAKRLGQYRTTISRMLKKAREEGIVTINIKNNFDGCFQLEDALEKNFNLKEAIVIPTDEDEVESIRLKKLGQAGSEFLKRILKDGDILGFAWGKSVGEVANTLKDCKNVSANIVPLVGGPPSDMDNKYHVNTIVSRVSDEFKAKGHYFYAPAITAEKSTKEAIMNDSNFKGILELWDKVNKAVVGIGAPLKGNNLIWSGYFGDEDIQLLKDVDAVGDICSRFFDINGNIVDEKVKDRIISVELEKLKKMEYSIAVAESSEKAWSILGALNGGFVNVLITNNETAETILNLHEQFTKNKK